MGDELRFTHRFDALFERTVGPLIFHSGFLFYKEEKWEMKAFRQNICQNLLRAELCMMVNTNKTKYSSVYGEVTVSALRYCWPNKV